MEDLGISKERKIEIDNILKESERKFQNGEIRCSPLIELENRLRKKRLWDEINPIR